MTLDLPEAESHGLSGFVSFKVYQIFSGLHVTYSYIFFKVTSLTITSMVITNAILTKDVCVNSFYSQAPQNKIKLELTWCATSICGRPYAHYIDVIMTTMASQITSLTVVYSIVYQAQIKENIKAPRHWPLCGEFTGTGDFPAQRASNAENVSTWWRDHATWGSWNAAPWRTCPQYWRSVIRAYFYSVEAGS